MWGGEHWPTCGAKGWIVTHHAGGRPWTIECSGNCRCRWIPTDADEIVFSIPRSKEG